MKRFIQKNLLFLFICSICYFLSLAIIFLFIPQRLSTINANYTRHLSSSYLTFEEAKSIENVDVLFIGSSTAYRGFDPRIFQKKGMKVMNLGTPSQTPLNTNFILNRFLDCLNPRIVVYTQHPKLFESDGTESSTDIISGLSIEKDFYEIIDIVFFHKNIRVVNTFIIKLFVFLSNAEIDNDEPGFLNDGTYISRGYVSYTKTANNTEIKEASKKSEITKNEWKPLDFQLDYFKRNIEMLEIRNIPFLLVVPPVPSHSYNEYLFSNLHFQNYINRFGTFIDYNKYLNLSDSLHFADSAVHLNQNGVEVFNNFMIDRDDLNLK